MIAPLLIAAAVTLAWNANPEPDIAGYRLKYGSQHAQYTGLIDVGHSTTGVVNGLTPGATYYFVVSAYNGIAIESLPSTELQYRIPTPTPTPSPTATPTPTPGPITIGGVITYCGISSRPAAGIAVTLSGSVSGSTVTDAAGAYSFVVPNGSSYTITPSKAPLPFGSPAISTIDSILVMSAYLSGRQVPCIDAGDVIEDGKLSILDVIAIQRFALGYDSLVGSAGQYRFNPRIPSLDFTALLLGDVQ